MLKNINKQADLQWNNLAPRMFMCQNRQNTVQT